MDTLDRNVELATKNLELLKEQNKLYSLTLAIITDHIPLEKRQELFNILSAYKQYEAPKPPKPPETKYRAVIYPTMQTTEPKEALEILATLAQNCDLTDVQITHVALHHNPNYPSREYHTFMCSGTGYQKDINYFREKLKPLSYHIE
jgi:hypothetical protein